MKRKVLSIRISDEVKSKAKEAADKMNITLSEFVCRSIENTLTGNENNFIANSLAKAIINLSDAVNDIYFSDNDTRKEIKEVLCKFCNEISGK